MANGRNPGKKRDSGRDPGGFAAIPFSVLDSWAWLNASHPAKALALELARQYIPEKSNNGQLLLTDKYLRPRGWKSPAVIHRAKRELLDAGLAFETAKGMRPNKASWFAITWRMLDRNPGYDFGAEQAFVRGAYRLKGPQKPLLKNARLTSPRVVDKPPIATGAVVEREAATTPEVAIRAVLTPSPTTARVDHLEVTISNARVRGDPLVATSALGTAFKGEKAGAPPEKCTRANSLAKKPSTICQAEGCETLILPGRVVCSKHRARVYNGDRIAQEATR